VPGSIGLPGETIGKPRRVRRGFASQLSAGASHGSGDASPGTSFASGYGMALFRDAVPAPYRLKARRELHRLSLELEYERRRASFLKQAASTNPELALKAGAADVRVAVLQARLAQLRRAAGRSAA
jgi:hypothetical protein